MLIKVVILLNHLKTAHKCYLRPARHRSAFHTYLEGSLFFWWCQWISLDWVSFLFLKQSSGNITDFFQEKKCKNPVLSEEVKDPVSSYQWQIYPFFFSQGMRAPVKLRKSWCHSSAGHWQKSWDTLDCCFLGLEAGGCTSVCLFYKLYIAQEKNVDQFEVQIFWWKIFMCFYPRGYKTFNLK